VLPSNFQVPYNGGTEDAMVFFSNIGYIGVLSRQPVQPDSNDDVIPISPYLSPQVVYVIYACHLYYRFYQ